MDIIEFEDHLHFWLLLWIICFYCQTCFIKLFLSSLYLFGFGVLYPNLFCALLSWKKQWSHSCAFTFKSHTSWQCTILGEAILLCVEHHSLIWYCIFLPFLNITSVWKIHGEWWSNLCAFVFKCKITNNAHILVKLLYVFEHFFNWLLFPMTCLFGRQTFFVLVFCASMKSVEGLVYSLMIFLSISILLSFGILFKWYLQSCVDLSLLI